MTQQTAIFQNVREVVKAEEACVKAHLKVTVIPTPKEFSKNCGMALRISGDDAEAFLEVMQKNGIDVQLSL